MKWGAIFSLLVLPLRAQELEDIRGAKPLVEIPKAAAETNWLPYLIGAAAILLIIAAIWWWLRRKKMHELSLEDWARLELDDLQKNERDMKPGDFALAASGVVRVFVERKFGLAAPKRTTEEFLLEISRTKNERLATRMEPLRGFLRSCDQAKFAGADLGENERENLITKAKEFVSAKDETQGKEAA